MQHHTGSQERQPVDRYLQLPDATRELIENEKKMAKLNRTIDFFDWVDTTRRYVKWTILTILAVFVTFFALADYVSRTLAWWRGHP